MSFKSKAAKTYKTVRYPIYNGGRAIKATREGMHKLGEKIWPMPTPVDRGRPELAGGRKTAQRVVYSAAALAMALVVRDGGALAESAATTPRPEIPELATPLTPEQKAAAARWADAETIATPFDERCGIVSATDTHRNPHLRDGKPRTTVVIKVQAPLSDQAKAAYEKYGTNGKGDVTWKPPVGIGFLLPKDHPEITHRDEDKRVADDNGKKSSDIKGGEGDITLFPPTNVEDGSRVGVYARVDATTPANGEDWVIHGDTPCGVLTMQGKTDGNPTWVFTPGADMSPVITADPAQQ